MPSDPVIETGSVSPETLSPERLHFHVESEKAVLNFDRFDIASSEQVDFHHHALTAESSVLSRVTGGDFSAIAGTLTSNGQLLLVNPAGIAIAPTANIQAASFIASTLQIDTPDFLEGKLQFRQDGKMPPAAILHQGRIMGGPGGLVALLGSTVVNEGSIVAQVGKVVLAAGERVTLSLDPRGELAVLLEEPPPGLAPSLEGGQVLVPAKNLPRIFDRLVNPGDFTEALYVVEQEGKIHLIGEGGILRHSGTIQADAGDFGDGGRVLLQSEKATSVTGQISARGGRQGGSGGFVDTSSHGDLHVEIGPDLSAFFGQGGLWLIDPRNVEITSTSSNATESGGDPDTFTPTGNNARVNVTAINTALNNGTSVTVNTGTTGGQPGNITVSSAISKASGGAATLLLTAANNITVNSTIGSTSGALHVTLRANDDSSGGGDVDLNAAITTNGGNFTSTGRDFDSDSSGTVTTAGGALTINHTRDVTVGAALNAGAGAVDVDAADDITANGSITTTTSNISLDAVGSGGDISVSEPITSTSGNITLNAADGVTLSGSSADISTAGTYTVNADTDAGDNNGDYNQNNAVSAVTITNNSIAITADDFKLTGTIDAGTGAITILSSDGGTIRLGSGSGNMTISGSELQNITAGSLAIGNATNGNITVNGILAANSNNISGALTLSATAASGTITFSSNPSTFNILAVNAGNGITLNENLTTDSGSFTANADSDASGAGTFTVASGVTLAASGNAAQITAADVALSGAINAGAGNVSFLPSTGTTIGLGTGAGTFNLTDSELDGVTTTGTLTIGNSSSSAITLDDLTLGAKNITLVSGSTINDDDDTGSALTTTGALTLISNGAIGNLGGPAGLNINAGNVAVTSASSINITQDAGDLLPGSLTATGSILLSASSGSILDNNGSSTNLRAGGNSSLTAGNVIGTINDPLDVLVTGATLSVGPRGQVNGISAVLSGSVTPSGTLGLIGTPPGRVIFNDQTIFELPLSSGTFSGFFGQMLSLLFAPENQRRTRSLAA